MADSYFDSEERFKRYQEMRRTGDYAGLRRMKFGEALFNLRRLTSPEISQTQAAKRAEITRIQWNRIENGHVRPLPATIASIAKGLEIAPAILLVLAGYEVPDEHARYDKKYAHQRMDAALEEGFDKTEFLLKMEVVWQEYQAHQMASQLNGLPEKIMISLGFPEVVGRVVDHLSVRERLRLAEELVECSPRREVRAMGLDYAGFYEKIRTQIEANRYGVGVGLNEDFII